MLAEERFANYDLSAMTPQWWNENVTGALSKLLVTCRVCKHVCRTTQISNLQQGQSFGCWCNGSVPWTGEVGYAHALEMLAEERFEDYDLSAMTHSGVKRISRERIPSCWQHAGFAGTSVVLHS